MVFGTLLGSSANYCTVWVYNGGTIVKEPNMSSLWWVCDAKVASIGGLAAVFAPLTAHDSAVCARGAGCSKRQTRREASGLLGMTRRLCLASSNAIALKRVVLSGPCREMPALVLSRDVRLRSTAVLTMALYCWVFKPQAVSKPRTLVHVKHSPLSHLSSANLTRASGAADQPSHPPGPLSCA
jgi:hypothetical protein